MAYNTEEKMKMNAQLQKKKNALRKELNDLGVLQKRGKNDYDHYKYFSEAQYKELFTELFSKHKIELIADEVEVVNFEGPAKQPFGRRVQVAFTLVDVETGFNETSKISGEGIDKGDKALYKAFTGALKYFLANTFMVATGDDPENEKRKKTEVPSDLPEEEKENMDKNITKDEAKVLVQFAKAIGWKGTNEEIAAKLCEHFNVEKLSEVKESQRALFIKENNNG